MKIRKDLMVGVAALGLAVSATPAFAQSEPQATEDTGIADIIVTAQKRQERLQDVPIAITAISADTLTKSNVGSIADFSRLAIPGLVSTTFVGSATQTFNIRGVSSQDASAATVETPIAVYVDGVYLPRFVGLTGETVEIERAEVLRGPQGTLFGRNAEGGAMSITSKKPTGKFEGRIGGEVGNYGRYKGYIHLNLPETANISTKIDAYVSKADGFTKNGPNDKVTASLIKPELRRNFGQQDNWGVRGQVLWAPSSSFSALLAGDYSKLKQANLYLHFDSPSVLNAAPQLDKYVKETPFSYYLPYIETEVKGVQLTLNYEITDRISVKSITAAREVKETGGNNLQGYVAFPSFFPGVPEGTLLTGLYSRSFVKSKTFSQEVQLIGKTDEVEYVVGAFYFRESADDQRGNLITSQIIPGLTPFTFGAVNIGTDNAQSVRASTFAAFAQATWSPGAFDGKLKITPGLRYSEAQKSGVRTKFRGVILPTPLLRQIPSVSRIDPALTIAYDFNGNVNAYLRYAQAFRDGGATVRSNTFNTFGSEVNKQVEFGVKSDLFDRKLRLNMAVYHSWVSDQQIAQTPRDDTTAQEIVNVPGTTRLWGFEAEATLAPTSGLLIGANLTLMDGEQPPYDCGLTPIASGGCFQQITFLPKTSIGASVDYTAPVSGDMEAFFHFDYKYTSRFHTSPKGFPGEVWPQSHFNVANARIGLNKVDLGPVRANISAFVDNVFDNNNIVFDTNVQFQTLQTPRQFGVAASIEF